MPKIVMGVMSLGLAALGHAHAVITELK
jgi:hypothetical protein